MAIIKPKLYRINKVMTSKKLLYIFDETDWKSRIPLAQGAKDKGYDVTIGIITKGEQTLANDDFPLVPIRRTSGGFTPFSIASMISEIRKTVAACDPDIVHTVTLKYSFLTGLARIWATKRNFVYTLAGLGYMFRTEGFKPFLGRCVISLPLKHVLRSQPTSVIFQNPDDLELMVSRGYVRKDDAILVKSSGVNLENFDATPLPPESETPIILMPTRLVHGKGVDVFVDAARRAKAMGVEAKFQIAGGETYHNPQAITRAEMEELCADGSAEWLGRVEDMPGLLKKATLVVYPSYYGEGVPRVLLESAASARAIITADSPGCKEAVRDGVSGVLTPIKNPETTANEIKRLMSDRKLLEGMAKESRKFMEAEFDVHHIVKLTLAVYTR
jgi:glycosyltransferase involved in cell wall biosynthesis